MSQMRRFRLLLVDDHEVINWGLRCLLGRETWVERCVSATSRDEALPLARRYEPHVALVDVILGAESGVETARLICEASPGTRILMMSGAGRISAKAMRAARASGFIAKTWLPEDIARAIRVVGLGLAFDVSPSARPEPLLSQRERDVLELVATGATNAEVADTLHLSMHTVKQHASAAYKKLNVRNRAEAVQQAERLGFIT